MGERAEALMRIIVLIVTGIILGLWKILIEIFIMINFIWTLISGKRIKDLADLSELWNTQVYVFLRYMTFVSNERPMPFNTMTKSFSKFSKK
jgi:sorbitol-specific phosphotransferase system component IIC